MIYYFLVHLVIIGNTSSQPPIQLQHLHTHNSRYPTRNTLYSYELIDGSSVNEFQKDSLINSNDDSEIEFMKMVVEVDGEDWQAFQGDMKISKSYFFRTIGDDSNYELARNAERNFRKKKFGLFCFNCNGAFIGLFSLAFSKKDVAVICASLSLGGYVLSKIIRMKGIDVSFGEAQSLARDYNQKLRLEFRPLI